RWVCVSQLMRVTTDRLHHQHPTLTAVEDNRAAVATQNPSEPGRAAPTPPSCDNTADSRLPSYRPASCRNSE
ncbi:hypothetical protein GOODEAATRI_027254, partial [Goodea atripinnis]